MINKKVKIIKLVIEIPIPRAVFEDKKINLKKLVGRLAYSAAVESIEEIEKKNNHGRTNTKKK